MLLGRLTVGTIGIMGGVPVVPTTFARSFSDLLEFNRTQLLQPNEETKVVWATVSTHAIARNSLVHEREGEWLFLLDTDMSFPPDALARLLRTMRGTNAEVVCGLYHFGSPPYLPVLYAYLEGRGYQNLVKWDEERPFLVGATGGGCLLVKSSVFEHVGEDPFTIVPPFGTDDFPFFEKCREQGIEVVCDPRVKCGHLRMVAMGEEQYRAAVGDVPTLYVDVLEA